jgi:hypothetical protein
MNYLADVGVECIGGDAVPDRVAIYQRLGVHPAYEGYRVGPCFADSTDIARRLLETIFARLEGKILFIDVPEPNAPAISLVEGYGMEPSFACIRMYTTEKYNQDVKYIFGNTTFEVG